MSALALLGLCGLAAPVLVVLAISYVRARREATPTLEEIDQSRPLVTAEAERLRQKAAALRRQAGIEDAGKQKGRSDDRP